jgi:hypothetical protein
MDNENNITETPPKVFISYAWSSKQHENWVYDLYKMLRDSGIDAILDKCDLNLGDDTIPFMEQIENDIDIKKVIMVCDKKYVQKANKRTGGVGIETQIISKAVYENSVQKKYIAIVVENKDNGSPYLPTYYTSRLYLDFTNVALFSERFNELIHWVFDKPIYEKPELGSQPDFLLDNKINPGTIFKQKRVIDNIINGRPVTTGSIKEYFDEYYEKLELFRIDYDQQEAESRFKNSISSFLPYRDEFLSVIYYISQYERNNNMEQEIHRFFEKTLSYLDRPDDVNNWTEFQFENYKFMLYELFMNTLAIFLQNENYIAFSYLINTKYFIKRQNKSIGIDAMQPFNIFKIGYSFIHTIKPYSKYTSPVSELLKERNKFSKIKFYYIMEADFICFLKSALNDNLWYPNTLIYLDTPNRPFEVFAKSIKPDYFNNLKILFGFNNLTEIANLLNKLSDDTNSIQYWRTTNTNPSILVGLDHLVLSNELRDKGFI